MNGVIFLAVAAAIPGPPQSPTFDPAQAARIPAYLARNRAALDLGEGGARFDARLLDTAGKQVILFGEVHGIALNEDLDLALLRYLHRTAGVRVYVSETGYAISLMLNRYLDTGDERVLDFVMQQAYGSTGWTKEHRAFYVNFRRWNLTLPEEERVHITGVDVEHLRKVALRWLAEAARPRVGKAAPAPIAETIAALQRMEQEPSGKAVERFIAALASSLASHRADYAALLGDRLFDFELVTGNLQKAVEFYAAGETPAAGELRERVMYDTFVKLYARTGGAKCYGRFGGSHVIQRRFETGEPFAAMLNRADSPVAGRVLSMVALYANSEALSMPGYGAQPAGNIVSADAAMLEPFAAASAGQVTLFSLTGADSPFRHDVFQFMQGAGVPADYVQYVVLVRNATASQPLGGRGKLGMGIQPLTPEVSARLGRKQVRGVLVTFVDQGGAAARAGIRAGDIITALNGSPVGDPSAFANRIGETAPGTTVTLSILRDKREQQVKAKLDG